MNFPGLLAAEIQKIRAAEPGLPSTDQGHGTVRSAGRRTADIVSVQVLNPY